MGRFTQQDLTPIREKHRDLVVVKCRLQRAMAGGQPATDKGLEAFVEHYLGLAPDTPEFKATIDRIKKEEIGERKTGTEEGEIPTSAV